MMEEWTSLASIGFGPPCRGHFVRLRYSTRQPSAVTEGHGAYVVLPRGAVGMCLHADVDSLHVGFTRLLQQEWREAPEYEIRVRFAFADMNALEILAPARLPD